MEFTQLRRAGLRFPVGLNPQCSHPVDTIKSNAHNNQRNKLSTQYEQKATRLTSSFLKLVLNGSDMILPLLPRKLRNATILETAKSKRQTQEQEQLSASLSQVLRTYDFGNFENCELNIDITLIYPCIHSLMYHECRNPQRRASSYL